MMLAERRDAAMLALQGVSLGDAFGQVFLAQAGVARDLLRRRSLPPGPWRWSDDTAMAASVVEVLLRHDGIDQEALAQAFARRYAADSSRGYGAVAHSILAKIGAGAPWAEATRSVYRGEGSMGNGGAMRVAPVGAYFSDDLAQVVREARASAEVTHAHPDGQAGAIAVAVAAAFLAAHARRRAACPPAALLEATLAHCPRGPTHDGLRAALRAGPIAPERAAEVLGDGAQVIARDTVPFALWCAAHHHGSFEDAMFAAMAGLLAPEADRDTICAIVGGVVAGSVSRAGLPVAWIERREPLPAIRATPG